jgi:DNA-binding transcriptional MocR family regulator
MTQVARHARDEIARRVYGDSMWNVSEDDMWKLLGYSKNSFTEQYQNAPTMKSVEEEEREQLRVPKDQPPSEDEQKLLYCKLLNGLSEHVRDKQGTYLFKSLCSHI